MERCRTFIWLQVSMASGVPSGSAVKNPPAMQETWFDPWVGKIPWRKAWQPTPVSLSGQSHGQRSLAGLQSTGLQRVGHDWATKHSIKWLSKAQSMVLAQSLAQALDQRVFSKWVNGEGGIEWATSAFSFLIFKWISPPSSTFVYTALATLDFNLFFQYLLF